MKRGFKIVSSKKDQDIHLPQRQTTRAAGYDQKILFCHQFGKAIS